MLAGVLYELHRDAPEVTAVGRVELPKVAAHDDVETAERPVALVRPHLRRADVTDDVAQLHVHLRQESSRDHADFIDNQPAPLQELLGDLHVPLVVCACRRALHDGDAARVVDRVTAQQVRHYRLEGHDLEVNSHVPMQHVHEEFLDDLDHMRLPRPRATVE